MGADGGPQPIGWEELLTRLAGRRGVTIDGDSVTLWFTRRHRVRLLLTSLFIATFLVGLSRLGDMPLDVFLGGVASAIFALWMAVDAVRPGPEVRVDAVGVHRRKRTIPWEDMLGWRLLERGSAVSLVVRVDPASPVVAALPGPQRRLRMRRAARSVLRGVVFDVAQVDAVPLTAEELPGLVDHPVRRRLTAADQSRPRWEDRTAKVAGVPGVHIEGDALWFLERGVERLRVDGHGVSGLLPDVPRHVPWEQLQGLGLFNDPKRPAILLMLWPGTEVEPPRGRVWAKVRRLFDQPLLPLPVRGLPFDAYEFALLLSSHPAGAAFWERNHPRS